TPHQGATTPRATIILASVCWAWRILGMPFESYWKPGGSTRGMRNTDTLYHLAQCYLHLAQAKRADVKSLRTAFERTAGEIAAIDPASVRLRQLQAGFYEADGDSD